MNTVNRIVKGVHTDHDPRYQPEGTVRASFNGRIVSHESGSYGWETARGNYVAFTLPSGYLMAAADESRSMLYIIAWEDADPITKMKLCRINIDPNTGYGVVYDLKTWNATTLNLSWENPIRRMIVFYESDMLQRIYFTDFNNQPRIINIQDNVVTTTVKFMEFTPVVENIPGNSTFKEYTTGNLYCGSYFICWRYASDEGYITGWSTLSLPVFLTDDTPETDEGGHQNFEGNNYTVNSGKGIVFTISNIDNTFDRIQVAFFFSNDYNSAAEGTVFFDEPITGTEMDVTLVGNENIESVLIDALVNVPVTINKCKDICNIRNINVVANIEERPDLDLDASIDVNVDENYNIEVMLDCSEWYDGEPPRRKDSAGALQTSGIIYDHGVLVAQKPTGEYSGAFHKIFGGIWYKVTGGAAEFTGESSAVYNFSDGDRFKAEENGEYTDGPGIFTPIVSIKKYRLGSIGAPSSDYVDYVWKEYELDPDHFFDYKNPVLAQHCIGYPGNEYIRLGVLFFDLQGKPFFVRHLNVVDFNGNTINGDPNMNCRRVYPGGSPVTDHRLLEGYELNNDTDDGDYGSWYTHINGRVLSLLISNLDITDIRDQISGFCIVRAPIIRHSISKGVLMMTIADGDNTHPYPCHIESPDAYTRRLNTYAYHSPEHLFAFRDFQMLEGDILENLEHRPAYRGDMDFKYYVGSSYTDWRGFGMLEEDDWKLYHKFYLLNTTAAPNSFGEVQHKSTIKRVTEIETAADDIAYNPANSALRWKKLSPAHAARSGHACKFLLVETNEGEDANNPVGWYDNSDTPYSPKVLLVDHRRGSGNPYGAIHNTSYIPVGHFQEINDTVLADIHDGAGNYIFNEIEIFGGDTFIGLFDLQRLVYDEDNPNDCYSLSFIVPMESRINLGLRTGEHISKNRTYSGTYNTGGILFRVGASESNYEKFNYNDGYSSVDIGLRYPSLPHMFRNISVFDIRHRWSESKVINEYEDKFRSFLADNKRDVNSSFGKVNNIREKYNRLFYWQDHAVGYMPVLERQMASTELGNPLQLGVGGILDRYDEMVTRIGNQHQFGLCESEIGFHWIDMERMLVLTLGPSGKLDKDSVVKGFNKWIASNVYPSILRWDNPFTNRGIVSVYDPDFKQVIFTIKQYSSTPGDADRTFVIDAMLNAFMGELPMYPKIYAKVHNLYLSANPSNGNQIYVHNKGWYRKFYGVVEDAYVTVIIRDPNMIESVFDNFIITGNDDFFNTIRFVNETDDVTETILDSSGDLANRNIELRNGRWYGNFPRNSSRKRFVESDYMELTFTVNDERNSLVRFLQMISEYRKPF